MGTTKFSILESDIYASIGDTVGIKAKADADKADFKSTVNEMRTNGAALMLSVGTESGKSHQIICATTKLASAMGGLLGLTIPESSGTGTAATFSNKKITSVNIPRKRSRS